MMNLNTWKKFNESLAAGGMTLGVSKPPTVGGLMGLHQEWDNDEDEDEDDDESDGDEDEGKEGDLIGSSHKDEGPDKGFPPENSEDDGELPFGDQDDPTAGGEEFGDMEGDDDFLASIGSGGGGKELGGTGGFGGAEGGFDGGGSEDDFLASLQQGGAGEAPNPGAGKDDMSFLNDINPDLLGGEFGGDEGGLDALGGGGLDALGGEDGLDALGGDAGAGGEPCPDCNPDGSDVGDPDCQSCAGEGFLDAPEGDLGDEFGGAEADGLDAAMAGADDAPPAGADDMNAYMNKMMSYMKKYMKKESMMPGAPPMPGTVPQGQTVNPQHMAQQMPQQMMSPQRPQQPGSGAPMSPQQQMMKKKMVKFMSKGGERSFMAADAPRKFMKKDAKACCNNETADFLNSLCNSAKGNNCRNSNGITEDSLLKAIDPTYESEPQAGQAGFAPQGRVGGIGNGYTKADFNDIPVLGESRRYPTLAEFAAHKAKKANARRR